MTTYQTMVPKMFLASKDPDKSTPIAVLPGVDGEQYNYRYVPFMMNGRFEADLERRKYKAFKWWWKNKGILSGRLKH